MSETSAAASKQGTTIISTLFTRTQSDTIGGEGGAGSANTTPSAVGTDVPEASE